MPWSMALDKIELITAGGVFNWIWCNYGCGQRLQLTIEFGAIRIQI